MDRILKLDLYRYGGKMGMVGLMKGMTIPGFKFLFFFRKLSKVRKYSPLYFIYIFFKRKYMFKYGIQIPFQTTIGEGFYIGHFGNIVINSTAKIGKFCNIAHGVTIGQTNRGERAGAPTIGDYVWIGTNSVIVGNVKIGNNVLIAPLSYVNFDVPDQSIVIGNPAKIISKTNQTEGYINFVK